MRLLPVNMPAFTAVVTCQKDSHVDMCCFW